MLKKETTNLLNLNNVDFKDLFSICIGKSYLYQARFIDYLGKYDCWNTDVREGILRLDDRLFNVEYIGTTSKMDNFWYSSEIETVIPDEYVDLKIKSREIMTSLGFQKFTDNKIELRNDINGYNLSMIYIAFSPENVVYFCGSGDTSIYMFVKNLPEDIFKKMSSVEFSNRVMEIISKFNVNHKLMVKALLIENEIEYSEKENEIIALFNEKSTLTVEFDKIGLISKIYGNLSM